MGGISKLSDFIRKNGGSLDGLPAERIRPFVAGFPGFAKITMGDLRRAARRAEAVETPVETEGADPVAISRLLVKLESVRR